MLLRSGLRLLVYYRKVLSDKLPLVPNGPAIWGGCVTRRKHQVGSWYFSSASWRITVQGGYGVVFAIRVQVLIEDTRVAIQI